MQKNMMKTKKNYLLFMIKHWETFIVRLDLFKGMLIALHL